jgi:hypothetical protein
MARVPLGTAIAASCACALASCVCTYFALRRLASAPKQQHADDVDDVAADDDPTRRRLFEAATPELHSRRQQPKLAGAAGPGCQPPQPQQLLPAATPGLDLFSPINVVRRPDPYDPRPRQG